VLLASYKLSRTDGALTLARAAARRKRAADGSLRPGVIAASRSVARPHHGAAPIDGARVLRSACGGLHHDQGRRRRPARGCAGVDAGAFPGGRAGRVRVLLAVAVGLSPEGGQPLVLVRSRRLLGRRRPYRPPSAYCVCAHGVCAPPLKTCADDEQVADIFDDIGTTNIIYVCDPPSSSTHLRSQ
jgi:hypothetical protein